jgi:hypothetical protein
VSIKNKLVTAITTAGLLAGLFGSAFVPVARAAASSTAAFTDATSTEQYHDTVNKIAYYSSAAYPVVHLTLTSPADATAGDLVEDGVFEAAVSGTTIRACVAASVSITSATVSVSGSAACAVTVNNDAGGGTSTITLTLNKIATGASVTLTVTDPDADTLLTYTLTGVAATADATVVDSAKSIATVVLNADGDTTNGETADVADEVIGGVNYFLPVAAGSDPVYNGVVSNQWGAALASATALIAELSNTTFRVGCDSDLGTAPTSSGSYVTTFNSSAAGVWECEVFADSEASAGGTWTLTVKATVSGKIVGSVSGAYYGELASLTASLVGGDRVPTAKAADANDFFKLVAKDANGKEYGLAELDGLNITAGSGIVAGATSASTLGFAEGAAIATKSYYQADNALCPAGSDGKTATIQATKSNATGTSIKSNTLTVTCAANEADGLTVDRIEFSKSNPVPGETFDVYVYMEDADGNLAGKGDFDSADFLLTLNGATVATDYAAVWDGPGTTIDFDETLAAIDGYGRITIGIKAPATVGTTISVNDPATSAIAKVFTTNDAYEGVLSVGPKKLKATADFGPAAAKKKVAFVLESASGTTKTYYRRADAAGVASFTLVLRGTWTVYATFGDEISDTGTMRR